jgi:hypothetical protein
MDVLPLSTKCRSYSKKHSGLNDMGSGYVSGPCVIALVVLIRKQEKERKTIKNSKENVIFYDLKIEYSGSPYIRNYSRSLWNEITFVSALCWG